MKLDNLKSFTQGILNIIPMIAAAIGIYKGFRPGWIKKNRHDYIWSKILVKPCPVCRTSVGNIRKHPAEYLTKEEKENYLKE